MATGYEYRGLKRREDEFRLLVLDDSHATGPKDVLKFQLQHESMLRAALLPEFYAVSYTWGDTSKQSTILVGSKRVSVPQNAETALRRFVQELCGQERDPNARPRKLYLWIDAICINHADREERSRQLSLMNAIYGEAKCVLIWLGEDEDGLAENAVQSIHEVVDQCMIETNNLNDLFKRLWDTSARRLSIRSSRDGLPRSCDLDALRSFYSSPWFTRLWVVMEACLAKQTLCFKGSSIIPFYDVALAAQWMFYRGRGRLSPDDPLDARHLVGIRNATEMWDCMGHAHATPKLLWTILAMTMEFGTTDPLDKIFALYPLIELWLKTIPGLWFVPDYFMSQGELYATATRAAIIDAGNLRILSIASRAAVPIPGTSKEDVEVPSWVPRYDWTIERTKGATSFIQAPLAGASNGDPARLHPMEGLNDTLSVQGLLLDTVQRTYPLGSSPSLDPGPLDDTTIANLASAWSATCKHASEELCRPLELAFAMALCAGQDSSYMPIIGNTAFQSHCAAFFQSHHSQGSKALRTMGDTIASLNQRRKDSAMDIEDEGDAEVYSRALKTVCYNRSFFITAGGRVGVGPKTMETGDRVCLVPGAAVPLVLRKSGICWRFVGDAYVHGMMDVSVFFPLERPLGDGDC